MRAILRIAGFVLALAGPVYGQSLTHAPGGPTPAPPPSSNAATYHVIIIDQENRSFDNYFGGYGILPSGATGGWTATTSGSTTAGTVTSFSPAITSAVQVGQPLTGGCLPADTFIATVNVGTNTVTTTSPSALSGCGAGQVLTGQKVNGLTNVAWPAPCPGFGLTGSGLPDKFNVCFAPFNDKSDVSSLGPHSEVDAQNFLNDGITTFLNNKAVSLQGTGQVGFCGSYNQSVEDSNVCLRQQIVHDVMGYMTSTELPNYHSYAANYTVLDNFFENIRGWSLLEHIHMFGGWVSLGPNGTNKTTTDPLCSGTGANGAHPAISGCQTANNVPRPDNNAGNASQIPYVNYMQLFDTYPNSWDSTNKITWKLYKGSGTNPDNCQDGGTGTCPPQIWNAKNPPNSSPQTIWNVAQYFNWVNAGGITGDPLYTTNHVPTLSKYFTDISAGTCALPNVSWILPTGVYSEHPPARVTTGMEYVTAVVNALQNSPCTDAGTNQNGQSYWNNTVIFIIWDDWGGGYDHVLPPNIYNCHDANNPGTFCDATVQAAGIRVPALMISAWQTPGSVDHSAYTMDSINTFIEDVMISGKRLSPSDTNLQSPAANAPVGTDTRPTPTLDALRGTSVGFCCGHANQTIGDLRTAGARDTNMTGGTPTAATDLLSIHIPTGLNATCGQSTSGFACTLGTVTLTWSGVSDPGTHCKTSGGTAIKCVPNPSAGITVTEKIYRDAVLVCTIAEPTLTCTDAPPSGTHWYTATATFTGQSETAPSAGTRIDMP